MRRIQQVLILGGGSAGFLTALALKIRLRDLDVRVVRSPGIGIIGVGEGTIWRMTVFLHGYLGIDVKGFHQAVHPTYKLGTRFLWGKRSHFHYPFDIQLDQCFPELSKPNGYFCAEDFEFANPTTALMARGKAFERKPDGTPLITTTSAYHLENQTFVAFLEGFAKAVGVEVIDDTLTHVDKDDEGVRTLHMESGRSLSADLYVDASGFRSRLLSDELGEPYDSFRSSLFCDRAVVGGWPRSDEPLLAFTTSETMNAGWAWQIEHERLVNRGYVYSSDFISDEDAEREFRAKNPKVSTTRVVRFPSGRYRRVWVKNVVAAGNASGFVEPLEATALWLTCWQAIHLVNALSDGDREVHPSQVALFNRIMEETWGSVRRFLALHYKFNTRLDTPFWRACREDTDLAGAEPFVEYFESVGPSVHAGPWLGSGDLFGMEGYLVILMGLGASYRSAWKPSQEERRQWGAIRHGFAKRADAAMTQEEALRALRAPEWQWYPDFYRNASPWY